jgi:ATP synthase protein I
MNLKNKDKPVAQNGRGDPGFAVAMSFGLRAGAQFMSAVLLGGGIGWALDRWFGTAPYGMLILMVLCFIAAMASVWRSMSRAVTVATQEAETAGDGVAEKFDGKSS